MKKTLRLASALLAFAILLTCTAFASSLGTPVLGGDSEIASGVSLAEGVYWSGSDFRDENYIEYIPSGVIYPMVVYGSKLCNYGSFSSMASLLEGRGYHVIGGINADYYDVATYCPLGIVIDGGKLISSDAGHYAVGFMADGTAITGSPAITATVMINGEKFPLESINKLRDKYHFALFTEDFSYTTKNSGAGRDVILSVEGGEELTVNCSLTLRVEEILESTGAVDIPEGKLILSLPASADAWRQGSLDGLAVGDAVTLNVSCSDARWEQVEYATGSLYKLVTNGAAEGSLPSGADPRTAVGIKADGTVVLYTIDGRQSGYSSGATMTQVAQRLVELGCVEACVMDGGGSTSLNALYIGDGSSSLVNSPSGGSPRSVTSYIVLVTKQGATGAASRLGVSPAKTYILSGATAAFKASAADAYAYPAVLPAVSWNASGGVGSVTQSGEFKAGGAAAEGTVSVTAPGLITGSALVETVSTPHILTVKNEATGKAVSSLDVARSASVSLTAVSQYYNKTLISQDGCYTWAVTGDIGTIDENGLFTASSLDASGSITVTAGEKTVTIPVVVGWANPFDDISETGDWYYEQIKYVCKNGLFSGETPTHFGETSGMTRGMFVTVLWRISGQPGAADAGFTDVAADKYYAAAVNWAAGKSIVSGYGDGTFLPDKTISREEICTLLYNYAKASGITLAASQQPVFTDSDSISPWALEAVSACAAAGLVTGNTDGTMAPALTMSRAHAAVLLARFHAGYFG